MCAEAGQRMPEAGAWGVLLSPLHALLRLPSRLLRLGHSLHVLRTPSRGLPILSYTHSPTLLQPPLASPTPGPLHRYWPP